MIDYFQSRIKGIDITRTTSIPSAFSKRKVRKSTNILKIYLSNEFSIDIQDTMVKFENQDSTGKVQQVHKNYRIAEIKDLLGKM